MLLNRKTGITAAIGLAVAGLASGCLSSNSGTSTGAGTASGPGKSTVEVMYGLGPDTEPGFKADVQNVGQAERHHGQVHQGRPRGTPRSAPASQGGNPPDVGLFPQPGLMCDLAKQKKLVPFDDADGRHRQGRRSSPASSRPGTCADGKVYGLPERGQRQERPVDRRAGVQGRRLTSRRRRSTSCSTLTREDQVAGQDPVVHRRRVRRGHRLADHRLDRGPRPALRRPGQLRQVGQGRS